MTERLTMSVIEVAETLGISETLARREIAAGSIPSFRLGKRILVYRDAFEAWLHQAASA